MGCAQTGSGKTASYLIPIIDKLLVESADPAGGSTASPQAVIVTPTRELANQIYDEARKLSAGSNLKARLAVGGTSTGFQSRRLLDGCNILVATTGRLKDFSEKKLISFERLQFLVLDEADRMLDQGFMPDIEEVVGNDTMPPKEKRQTLLYSATFSDEVQEAAKDFLGQDYLFVSVGMVGALCSDVNQEFIKVGRDDKREKLEEILQKEDRDPQERTLVFVETKKSADFLSAISARRICPPPPSTETVSSLRGTRLWTISRLARSPSWWRPLWLPGDWTSPGWAASSITTCPRREGRTSTSTGLVAPVVWAILARPSPSWTVTTTPSC